MNVCMLTVMYVVLYVRPVRLECEKITYLGVRTIRVSDILERIRYEPRYVSRFTMLTLAKICTSECIIVIR